MSADFYISLSDDEEDKLTANGLSLKIELLFFTSEDEGIKRNVSCFADIISETRAVEYITAK